MKIKTFVVDTAEEMDTLVNAFESGHKVKATQTQHSNNSDGLPLFYRATVFYLEDD